MKSLLRLFSDPNMIRFLAVFSLLCIFFVALVVRLNLFTSLGSHESSSDFARDYLFAHHIVAYGEFPLNGPLSYLGAYANSPAYYYLNAAFMAIHDDIVFLGFLNVFLQAFSVILVFLLTRTIFSNATAYCAAFIFTFLNVIIWQSADVWQPHAMQFFWLLSLLCLGLGFMQKKYWLLYMSALLFVYALMLHSSLIVVVPFYACALLFILIRHKARIAHFVFLPLVSLVFGIFLLSPIALFFITHPAYFETVTQTISTRIGVSGFVTVGTQSIHNLVSFFAAVFNLSWIAGKVLLIIVVNMCFLYVLFMKHASKRYTVALICGAIVSNAIAVSMLNEYADVPLRYFTPVYVPFVILISELFVCVLPRVRALYPFKVIAVLVCAYLGFSPLVSFHLFDIQRALSFEVQHPQTDAHLAHDMPAVIATIEELKLDAGVFPDFTYMSYVESGVDHPNDALFWVFLEAYYNAPLVRIDDTAAYGYVPIASSQYVFVRCRGLEPRECAEVFLRDHDTYHIDRTVRQSAFATYLLARKI